MASRCRLARRLFLTGAIAALAEGCGHSWVTEIPDFAHAFVGGDDLPLTQADVDSIGYASLAVRLGKGKQALLILARYDRGDLEWVSHDREAIVTRRGRIVETSGLPQDLRTTEFLTADPVVTAGRHGTAPECVRSVDIEPVHEDGILIRSKFAAVGFDELAVLGRKIHTAVWEEKCAAPDIGWEFTNAFWFDAATGFLWKSIQHTAPRIDPLETIVFKPAIEA